MALLWNWKVMVAQSIQAPVLLIVNGPDSYSVDGSVAEEMVSDGDDGNFSTDNQKHMEEDHTADKLLDCYTLSPPGVPECPSLRNMFTCSSVWFFSVLLQEIVGDTYLYTRRKFAST